MTRTVFAVAIAGLARVALAAAPGGYSIDIPVEDLGTALLALATTTHQQIAFDYKSVASYRSTALSGTYTVAEALQDLIGPAPFVVRATPSGVFTVSARAPAAVENMRVIPRQPPLPAAAGAAVSATTEDEIVVSARRLELAPRVRAYVNEVVGREEAEGYARWYVPVCPLVTGLRRAAGEFILERISELARGSGVPLAGEHCRQNLFVFVTPDPKQLLTAMNNQHRAVTFGRATPLQIDEFIAAPRAARVWYNSATATPDNIRAEYHSSLAGQVTQPSGTLQPGGGGGAGLPANPTTEWEQASHVTRSTESAFTYVYVVIDKGRLNGVTLEQLADYIAVVGLAKVTPGAKLGDAPTILKLFDGAPQAALPRMSDWDQAFMKSLYATEQNVTAQKGEIALGMLRAITHQ
jgi:hypothetical protein